MNLIRDGSAVNVNICLSNLSTPPEFDRGLESIDSKLEGYKQPEPVVLIWEESPSMEKVENYQSSPLYVEINFL